jgi:penicillin-binding protein 1A
MASFYLYLTPTLPNANQLKTTQLQTPLRIFSQDKKRIAEFGEKRRTPVNIHSTPPNMINAFVAAEDNRFFEHFGIDIKGLARAATQLARTGRIQSGGSTITMQVAKNFFLSREKTFIRKFNEIFLALQIEQTLTKDEILELYLNKIYLGNRAYGIQAAAQVYYGKDIHQLDLAQLAMIAGLPKAPSKYNPLANPERAKLRRNWILDRMLDLEMIDNTQHQTAHDAVITASYHGGKTELYAPYVAEMARREIVKKYGANAYTSGMKVYLTIDSKLQAAASTAVKKGLESYDRRHGYRGPIKNISNTLAENRDSVLSALRDTKTPNHHQVAVVLSFKDNTAKLLMRDNTEKTLFFEQAQWARAFETIDKRGPKAKSIVDILNVGDIVQISTRTHTEDEQTSETVHLTQTPEAQGALVSLSPKDGAIKALVGGYDFGISHYNRAIQAKRQPGSNFKAFIYLAALENGATASTLINDAPIVFEDKNLEAAWRPENSSGKFYGPTRIRKALYNSRNLVSIRLLKETGVRKTLNTVEKFGFNKKQLPRDLSLALGSAALPPMSIASGYSMIANGGFKIEPHLIERIEDHEGKVIYRPKHPSVCQQCPTPFEATTDTLHTPAQRIADERAIYILHSMLKDVIKKGTGRRALKLKRNDLAGKTGTTNDQKDAWFSGFNTELETSVWVGFDQPKTLGRREYGAKAALPIWSDYMAVALKDQPEAHLPQPDGLVTVRIDKNTGQPASPGTKNAMFEIFREEFAPKSNTVKLNNPATPSTREQTLSPEDIF